MRLSNASRVMARLSMDLIQIVDRARQSGPDGLSAFYVSFPRAGKIALVIASKHGDVRAHFILDEQLSAHEAAVLEATRTAHDLVADYCAACAVSVVSRPRREAPPGSTTAIA